MKIRSVMPLVIAVTSGFAYAEPTRPAAETLGAFVGQWTLDLRMEPETFGDRAGDGTGTMDCEWGPMQAWVDCDLSADYTGIGQYALKIVLYPAAGETYGAFVTNTFGGGRLYTGRWTSASRLVYHDAWIDPDRKWERQRTTYTFHANGELSFAIEVSHDGNVWLPHSGGTYRRAPQSLPEALLNAG